jgi:mxaJ protein
VVDNVRGYMLYGDYSKPNPPAEIVRAVERGDVDVALVWGPLAGYFAAQSPVPLRLERVTPWLADMQWPMQFDISVGVQNGNDKLLKQIDQVLARRARDIRKLLNAYHVPIVEAGA